MKKILLVLAILSLSIYTFGQLSYSNLSEDQKKLYDEHMFGGQPDNNEVLVRTAYITSYNEEYRIPNYSVYHIVSDYLNTPERTSRFSTFRKDPDVNDAVVTDEYTGLYSALNYARGHFAPYKVFGGDRDGDGQYAHLDKTLSDIDEEKTVFEGNYMSNIAPQLHFGFNGSGGLWFKAERWIQDVVVKKNNNEVWVYSGGIIIDHKNLLKVGDNNSIVVPDMFYKVVIKKNETEIPDVLVFLFPHYARKEDVLDKDFRNYLVSVDFLETLTGYDFFNTFEESEQIIIESSVRKDNWNSFFAID
jgi:endonuclease G, mitochondrial